MNTYELTVITRPEDDQYKAGLEIIKKEIEKEKGKIDKQDDWGVKDLAYTIKKQQKGHYTFYNVSLEPESIAKLDERLRIKTELLKYLFVKA